MLCNFPSGDLKPPFFPIFVNGLRFPPFREDSLKNREQNMLRRVKFIGHCSLKLIFPLIGIVLLLCACSLTRKTRYQMPVYHSPDQVQDFAYHLMDSLKTIGQDTSLLILRRCVGCIPGSKTHGSLIYVKNDRLNLIEIDNLYVYYYDNQLGYFNSDLVFDKNTSIIDSVNDKSGFTFLDHYWQDIIIRNIGKENLYKISLQRPMVYNKRYIYIYYIESYIYDILSRKYIYPKMVELKYHVK